MAVSTLALHVFILTHIALVDWIFVINVSHVIVDILYSTLNLTKIVSLNICFYNVNSTLHFKNQRAKISCFEFFQC